MSTNPACACYACIGDRPVREGTWLTVGMTRMIVCAKCGNKRCPHGTDHRLDCTGSNEPGQVGSRYGMPNREPDDRTPQQRARDFLADLTTPAADHPTPTPSHATDAYEVAERHLRAALDPGPRP